MNYYTTVPAEKYNKLKHEYEEMGMSTDHLKPVDIHYGYVPMNVTKESKDSSHDLEMSAKCNNERFGL